MRKQIALSFLIICLVMICGCFHTETPQTLYCIGRKETFGDITLLVAHDMENEFFKIHYDFNEDCLKNEVYFEFELNLWESDKVDVSNFYFYESEETNVINFDEYGKYYFCQDKTIYVSYKSAELEVKENINLKKFDIDLGLGTFIYYQDSE